MMHVHDAWFCIQNNPSTTDDTKNSFNKIISRWLRFYLNIPGCWWSGNSTATVGLSLRSTFKLTSATHLISMSTEETPLLADGVETHNDVYRRFSPRRKKAIIGMVSGCGLIPCKYNILPQEENCKNVQIDYISHSFCHRNFHPVHLSNCKRPWHHRIRRKVNSSQHSCQPVSWWKRVDG